MKRILAVLLACAFVVGAASTADAGQRKSDPITLMKRISSATLPIGSALAETSYFSHQSARTDTFYFTCPRRAFVPYVIGADSLSLFDITISPASDRNSSAGTTAGSDSVYLTLAGSFNGRDWTSAPQVALLEINASDQYFKGYATTRLGAVTAAAATNLQMGVFPFYRLEVLSDATGAFQVSMQYWQDNATSP